MSDIARTRKLAKQFREKAGYYRYQCPEVTFRHAALRGLVERSPQQAEIGRIVNEIDEVYAGLPTERSAQQRNLLTGLETLAAIRRRAKGNTFLSLHPVDAAGLQSLNSTDLELSGYGEITAAEICGELSIAEFDGLGKLLGCKFSVDPNAPRLSVSES